MPTLTASSRWLEAWPGAVVGAMTMSGLRNPDSDPALDLALDETAATLRARYAGATRPDLLAVPEFGIYQAFYRRFDKTYHVLLQLESVALKGKPLRARGALVAAMFRAELEDGLLTAGSDATLVVGDLHVDVAGPGDRYVGIGGREIDAMRGDMCIRDAAGIISTVTYGPDDRTRLGPETTSAIFTTYAPTGIGADSVRRHLEGIAATVRRFAPGASLDALDIVPTSDDER